MDVAAYIKELLYQERVIYVAGLGTFLTRKSAGIYNQEQQQFYPPKNSIDFVEEEKQDEALENYISANKNISTAAARYFIEKFVEQLKNESAAKNLPVKEVLFPAEEEVKTGVAVTAYNMENFGLQPISLPSKVKPEPKEKEPVAQENYVENFYHEFSNSLTDTETETQPKRNTSFWASVFLLLAVSLLGFYALYLYYPDLLNRFSAAKPATQIITQPVVDTLGKNAVVQPQAKPDNVSTKAAIDTPKKEVIKNTAVPLPKAENAPEPPTKDNTIVATTTADQDLVTKSPYEIIGASFKTMNGAEAFLNQLKAKGMHHAKILSNTAGKQKLVTFGSFKDKEAAAAALEKLRIKDPQSEAYIQHYIIK